MVKKKCCGKWKKKGKYCKKCPILAAQKDNDDQFDMKDEKASKKEKKKKKE